MKTILRTVADAALFILSVLVIFRPESRSPTARLLLMVLTLIVIVPGLVRDFRSGALKMTPAQLYEGFRSGTLAPRRTPVLHGAAVMLSCVAAVMMSL